MKTSTPGTEMTTAIANAGTVGYNCGTGNANCSWTSFAQSNSSSPWTFSVGANQSGCSNLGPVSMNGTGGPTYAAGSLAYNSIAHDDANNNTDGIMTFSGSMTSVMNVTALVCIATGTPLISDNNDWDMFIIFTTSGNYAVIQFSTECTTTALGWGVRIESGHPTTHSGCIYFPTQTTHWFSLNYNMSTGLETLNVYNTDGTLVGTATVNEEVGGGLGTMYVGNNEAGNNSGTTSYLQNIMLNWTTAPVDLFWTNDGASVQPPTNLAAAVATVQ
jgi:hypothetical protein